MDLTFILKVIELFNIDNSIELTILEIARKTGLNYNTAYRTVEKLIKEKVLNSRKLGGSRAITLRNTPLALGFMSLIEAYKSKDIKDYKKKVGEHEKRFR